MNGYLKDIEKHICRKVQRVNTKDKNIIEESKTSTKVEIKSGGVGKFVHCNFEAIPKLFPFFEDVTGLKNICDAVLFTEKGNKKWVLLIELKQSKRCGFEQTQATKLLVQYILDSIERVSKRKHEVEFRHLIHCKNRRPGQKWKKVKYDEKNRLVITGKSLTLTHYLK